jgi:dihydrofolate reductase
MRNVVYAINISLDGRCDHTKMIGDEEIHEYFTHLMRDVDLLVFGRKTYQLMVPFWPDVAKNHSMTKTMNEFADTSNSIDKIIFSQSLDSTEGNARIVRTKLHDEMLKLKQEQGKNILTGRRLLEGISLQERLQLKLVESKILKSGCVALRYLKQ